MEKTTLLKSLNDLKKPFEYDQNVFMIKARRMAIHKVSQIHKRYVFHDQMDESLSLYKTKKFRN